MDFRIQKPNTKFNGYHNYAMITTFSSYYIIWNSKVLCTKYKNKKVHISEKTEVVSAACNFEMNESFPLSISDFLLKITTVTSFFCFRKNDRIPPQIAKLPLSHSSPTNWLVFPKVEWEKSRLIGPWVPPLVSSHSIYNFNVLAVSNSLMGDEKSTLITGTAF